MNQKDSILGSLKAALYSYEKYRAEYIEAQSLINREKHEDSAVLTLAQALDLKHAQESHHHTYKRIQQEARIIASILPKEKSVLVEDKIVSWTRDTKGEVNITVRSNTHPQPKCG